MSHTRRSLLVILSILLAFLSSAVVYFTANTGEHATTTVDNGRVYAWPSAGSGTGEASVDVDPTNSSIMVYHALGLSDYVPYYSTDGGHTWSKSSAFTVGANTVLLDPWISFDASEHLYAGTYIGNSTHPYDWQYPFLAKSTDLGKDFAQLPNSFSPPWTTWLMPDGSSKPSCAMQGPGAIDFPKVVADKSTTSPYKNYLYIFGAAGVNSTGSALCIGQASFIRSTDGGATWDIHRVLNGLDNQAIVRPDNVAVSSNGTIYFATTYTGGGILLVYSKNGGTDWSTNPISLGFGAGNPWISVSPSNPNSLYIVFERSNQDSSIHIYMITSENGGASWSSPTRLDDTLSNDTVDHTLPVVSVTAAGNFFAAWRDFRNTPSKLASNSNTTDIYGYPSSNPKGNVRLTNSTGRYCGYYSPCYRVTGNDFFTIASSQSTIAVAFSTDQESSNWPQAYASIVSYSVTSQPNQVIPQVIVTNLFVIAVAVAVVVLTVSLFRRTRTAPSRSSESNQSPQNAPTS